MKTLLEASASNPCIHCGKTDWCYSLQNGATVCNRENIAQGWKDSGKKDKQGAAILYPEDWGGKPPEPKPIKTTEWVYYYRDALTAPLVKVIRIDLDNGNKKIFQNYHNGKTWVKTRPKFVTREEIPVYRLAEIQEAIEANKTIFVVEGEKCADRLWALGIPATCNIQGSKSFSASDAADLKGASVVLVPDYDRPGVELMRQWAKYFPESPWLYCFPHKDWKTPPPDNGIDVYDWIEDGRKTAEEILEAVGVIPESLKKPVETSNPLAPAREYQEIETEYPFTEEAVRDLYNHGGRYVALDGTLYKFNGTHYERLIPELEKIRIRQWTAEFAVYDPKTKKQVYRHMNPRSVNSIWDWALLTFSVAPDSVNPPGVNLANGVLKIEWQGRKVSWKLAAHNPDVIYTYCSDVAFNPNASPEQCDRLLECLDPAPRTAMLRQIAASLDLANVRKLFSRGIRAGIARGAGSNGKDSLKEAVGLIFGSQVVSVTLSDFKAYDDGRKFYLAKLKHGTINWASENNKGTSLDGLDGLNICVTGDKGLDIEEKNKQPTQIQPQAIHLFNVNRLPKIASGLDSILSRFVVYDFNKTFKSNPDPMRGELLADPRFKEDPKFLVEQVCPALLNRLLAELDAYTREGIDYDSIKHSLDDIQEESTHLWTFAKDVGLGVDSHGKVYVGDLWETLKAWYVDNGTLEIAEMDNGKTKNVWNDQANKWDANISGPNQIYKRMKLLFPKIDRIRETKDVGNMGRWFLSGISINSASVASEACPVSLSASEPASDCFSFPYSASERGEGEKKVSEAKTEAQSKFSEAETRSLSTTEAPEAKNSEFTLEISQSSQPHKQIGILESGDEAFIYMINLEKARLEWDTARLRQFAKETVGAESFESMTPAQKMNLVYALRKEDHDSLNN